MFKVGKHMLAQFAGVASLVLCVHSFVGGQTITSRLEQTGEFDTQSTTLRGQLVDFAKTYRIPMGIELAVENEKPLKRLQAKNEPALSVLKRILQQRPGHDFDLSDEVLNVYPVKLVNDPRNFLNLRLPRYQVNDQSIFGARYYLKLGINQMLHPAANYGGGFGGVGLNNDVNVAKITFSGTNLTVRQILNRLISTHNHVLWIVQLNPSKRMRGEPFYAQALPSTDLSSSEFFWEFIPL